jgi:hypothetical protein
MAMRDYDVRERLANGRRAVAELTSVVGIVLGIVIVAAILGVIFFILYDRTPSRSTVTSVRPTEPYRLLRRLVGLSQAASAAGSSMAA